MITSYSFDKDVDNLKKSNYVDNLKISNYDYQLLFFDKEIYVDNLNISDIQLL